MRRICFFFFSSVLVSKGILFSAGTPFTYNGGVANWGLNTSWTPSGVPNNTDDAAIFPAGTNDVILTGGSFTVGTMTFEPSNSFNLVFGGTTGSLNFSSTTTPMINVDNSFPEISRIIVTSSSGPIDFVPTNGGSCHFTIWDLGGQSLTLNVNRGSAAQDLIIFAGMSNGGPLVLTGDGIAQIKTFTTQDFQVDLTVDGPDVPLTGSNSFANTVNVTMNSGLLDSTGQTQTVNTITGTGGTINLGNGFTVGANNGSGTFSGQLTGTGSLTVKGTGTLVLTDSNTYSGGTNINQGTLSISNDNNLGSPSGSLAFASPGGTLAATASLSSSRSIALSAPGSISVSSGKTAVFLGNIGGSSSLTLPGAGVVVLNGNNNYSGGTFLTAGVLQGTTSGLQGNITTSSGTSVIFDQSEAGVFGGAISGGASLTKQNMGSVSFTGINAIGGTTTVAVGALSINNSLTSTGVFTVQPQGILGGVGPVISAAGINVNGMLSPGNSIGTIALTGPVVFGSSSILLEEISPTVADATNITGTLNIAPGASLHIVPLPGFYDKTYTQTIVTTTGGLTGRFSQITSFPTFDSIVSYTANNIILMVPPPVPFSDVIKGGNAGAVAVCLDTILDPAGSDAEFIDAVLELIPTVEELRVNIDQLQPAQFTALALAQENGTFYLNDTLFYRLDEEVKTCRKKSALPEKRAGFWAAPLAGLTYQRNRGDQVGFKDYTVGAALGLDYLATSSTLLGAAVGYSYIDLTWRHQRGHGSANNVYGALYGSVTDGKAYLLGSVVGGYNSYQTTRRIILDDSIMTTVDRRAKGTHAGWQGSAHLKGGLLCDLKSVLISPFLVGDYLYVYEDGFRERNANSLNLVIKKKTSDLLAAELGLEFSRCFPSVKRKIIPSFIFSLIREQRFKGKRYRASFVDSSCVFDVHGYNPSRTLFSSALGLTFLLPDASRTLSFEYKGKYREHYQDHRFLAEFLMHF